MSNHDTESIRLDEPPIIGQKRCRACYSFMPARANKCIACQSLQDWQRFISFSNTFLSLLVALVSVLTFAIPAWERAFHKSTPRPVVAFVNSSGNSGVSLTLSNGGDAPMTLSLPAALTVQSGRGRSDPVWLMTPPDYIGTVIVQKDQIIPLSLILLPTASDALSRAKTISFDPRPVCTITVYVLTPSGQKTSASTVVTRVPCRDLVFSLVPPPGFRGSGGT